MASRCELFREREEEEEEVEEDGTSTATDRNKDPFLHVATCAEMLSGFYWGCKHYRSYTLLSIYSLSTVKMLARLEQTDL